MQADLLVFDLDGTLIDSALDLALAVNAARADAGLGPLPHERIYSYVGDGAPLLIRRALGAETSDKLVEEGLRFFYAYYREHMLDNTGLYAGVGEALEAFGRAGKPMAVLTNKPVGFSRRIIAGLGLTERFPRVYGGDSFETKKPDPYGLKRIIEESGTAAERTLMIGDSAVDIVTARRAGVPSCGVSYGLRPETFREHPPDVLVDSLVELAEMLGVEAAQPAL